MLDFLQQRKVRCAAFWEATDYHKVVNSLMLKNICIDPSVHNLKVLSDISQKIELQKVIGGGINV